MTNSYQGYARRKGFSPINVGSQNIQNIRQEGQRIIQGMESRRNAEISYRNDVLQQMQANNQIEADQRRENFEAEERYYDSIGESFRTNYEIERDNLDRKIKSDNKIYETLGNLSQTAAKINQQVFQYKFDKDYEDEISKLLLGYIDPNKQVAQTIGEQAIEVEENRYQAGADALAATGTRPLTVAQVRSASPGRQYARDKIRSAQAVEDFPIWLGKQLATDNTTKIIVPGKDKPITPMEAVTAQEKQIVANTLAMTFLKQSELYGLKPEFLTPTLQGLRKTINDTVRKAEVAELVSLQEEQLNQSKDKVFDKVDSPQTSFLNLYNAFRRTTDENGLNLSPGEARRKAFDFIINAKNKDGYARFTDEEIKNIFRVSFEDQPNTPISERYSFEINELLAQREDNYVAKVKRDQALVDAQNTEQVAKARLYLENAPVITEKMIEDLREAGKKNPLLIQLAERFGRYTIENQQIAAINQDFQDRFEEGSLTIQRVNTSLLPPDGKAEWVDRLTKAGMVPQNQMSKDDNKFAKDYVSSRLKGLLKAQGTPSEFAETQSSAVRFALQRWRTTYQKFRADGASPDEAYEAAQKEFDAQIKLSQDGKGGDYQIEGEPRDQVFTKFKPQPGVVKLTGREQIETRVRELREAGSRNPYREAAILDRSVVESYFNNVQAGRIPPIPSSAFIASNISGGKLSPFEVLKLQADYYNMPLPDSLVRQAEAARQAVQSDGGLNKLLFNYKPNYTRSQIGVTNTTQNAWRQPQNMRSSVSQIAYGTRSDYVGSTNVVETGYTDNYNRPITLAPPAASAFESMIKAGMPLTNITNVYRDEDEYLRLTSEGYGAASNSAHNYGEAMDAHGATKDWLIQYGEQYGWYLIDYEGSHGGHFEYRGN